MVSATRTIPRCAHHPWQPASSRVRPGPPPRLVFLSPTALARRAGLRLRIDPAFGVTSAAAGFHVARRFGLQARGGQASRTAEGAGSSSGWAPAALATDGHLAGPRAWAQLP